MAESEVSARPQHTMLKGRLEAFSDGVIAVIVTIMVLELHVPKADGWSGFLGVLPRIAIYVLSFAMVGIYWINHHELMRRSEQIDYPVLWANLVFLLGLSFIPFAADYVGEKHFDSFAALLYDVAMIVAGGTFYLLRATVMRLQKLHGELERQHRVEAIKHLISLAVYCVAIPVAFVHPSLSFALNVMVTLLWIIPEVGTKRLASGPTRRHISAE